MINIESISSVGEIVVGITLVLIGIRIHTHAHEHGSNKHVHIHKEGGDHSSRKSHVYSHASLFIGIIHGLAGASHFIAVTPAVVMPTVAGSIGYFSGLIIGTLIAMYIFNINLNIPIRYKRGVLLRAFAHACLLTPFLPKRILLC